MYNTITQTSLKKIKKKYNLKNVKKENIINVCNNINDNVVK